MMRAVRWGVIGTVLLVAGGAFWIHRLKTNAPFRDGTFTFEGLEGPVEVLRDSLGVPHIFAESEHDLFFAQGVVHASDRLWQMDQFRRVAAGSLSEVFGSVTLETDQFLRTLGMERAARRDLLEYPADVRSIVEAYAAGVSAALAAWSGPLPPEFFVLRVAPGPWEPAHSVAIEKVMSWDLTAYGSTVALTRAYQRFGPEKYEHVAPWYPDWGVTIVGDTPEDDRARGRYPYSRSATATTGADTTLRGASPAGRGASPAGNDRVVAPATASTGANAPSSITADAGDDLPLPTGLGAALIDGASVTRASNAWVVGGDRTRSGKPLLANDMHLALNHPNIWYLVGLHGPETEVVGMSLPGVPGVVAGHNAAVAWGFTNASLDDLDLFVERYADGDPDRYETPDGSAPFESFEERILIKKGDPVPLTVRETRHGPVLASLDAGDAGDAVTLRWAALDRSTTFQALLRFNRAESIGDVVEGVDQMSNPHQNVVFADTAGAFGYWMGGTVPLREGGGGAVTLPVRGWTGRGDWTGSLPFSDHPHVLNPEAGYVVTANNRQSRDAVSLLISEDWAPPFRAERITQLVEARSDHDVQSMLDMQLDAVSAWGQRYRGVAVDGFEAAGLDAEAEALRAWDGSADVDSHEAALFETWARRLRAAMRVHTLESEDAYYPMMALTRALEGGDPAVDALAADAAREAVAAAGGAAWGELHRMTLAHPMSTIRLFGRIFGFGRSEIPRAGGTFTVNVASYGEDLPPYSVTHGPSQRHVVDLSDVDGGGGFILPGGQSGLPGHRNSFDQLERWQRGELWLLPLDRALVESRTVERAELRPDR